MAIKMFNPNPDNSNSDVPDRFSVSWMTSWATTGQIMVSLRNTNIPELYGTTAEFPNFLFGPDMNEAAVSGRVDATNTGIVPTINLLAAKKDWIVICRLIDFPVSVVVPKDSGIESIKDLSGKTVGVPFGGGSHPYILQRLAENGLEVGEGIEKVNLVNLKPPEQPIAFQNGSVDAVATWEPQTALSVNFDGKIIDRDTHVGFLAIPKSFAEKYPDEVVQLLKAYLAANFFVSQNRELADRWFMDISNFKPELLKKIEVIEPNLNAKSFGEIDIIVDAQDIQRTQQIADVMFENELTIRRVNFVDHVDMSYLKRALEDLKNETIDSSRIQVQDRFKSAG